jgi:uncharacterized Zn-binding protein involved in type VI secretion
MPAIAFKGCKCTGHGPYPPRANDAGSGNVFVEGIPVHRVGDHWPDHTYPKHGDSSLAAGSGTVFANGIAVGRIGDMVACGSAIAEGCSTVFAG